MKCKHEHAIEWRGAVTAEPGHISTDRLVHLLDGKSATRMTHRICADCDAWLPLGPSSDDSDAVRVEMRAAEIAADDAMFNWEEFGWGCHEHGLDPDFTESSCFAGYLARIIATHPVASDEVGDVSESKPERLSGVTLAAVPETTGEFTSRLTAACSVMAWPVCPRCGEYELYSSANPPTAETIVGCLGCHWIRPQL